VKVFPAVRARVFITVLQTARLPLMVEKQILQVMVEQMHRQEEKTHPQTT
jgi:hypothetical protein